MSQLKGYRQWWGMSVPTWEWGPHPGKISNPSAPHWQCQKMQLTNKSKGIHTSHSSLERHQKLVTREKESCKSQGWFHVPGHHQKSFYNLVALGWVLWRDLQCTVRALGLLTDEKNLNTSLEKLSKNKEKQQSKELQVQFDLTAHCMVFGVSVFSGPWNSPL